ncbi:DUF2487 family protein [Cohnella terricola]|uniref:DUF2487 family protein n=1 Tax=Cohnella terricola TaxID=1289167 RepID=A0A559JXG9_9BACL|nr:DUF2487 family protein [Cohnella terricola]TVY04585.1 DUF2487 family protein [Cohnella terricola]
MKFGEIDPGSWPELQPYLDTCLLPMSGLTGEESPWEAADKAARTGEWLSPLEQAFRGRTVTMPAYHYEAGGKEHASRVNRIIDAWKKQGFRYVVVVSGQPLELADELNADLFIRPNLDDEEPEAQAITKALADLWRKPRD